MTKQKELKPTDENFLPVKYSLTQKQLAQLSDDYDPKLIPEAKIKGDSGYQLVHSKVMDITKVRTNIEKIRKELKAESLAWGKLVDGEAKRLTAIVVELEKPWKDLKTDLDEKEAREAEEARIKEVERIREIEIKVSVIQLATSNLVGAGVAALKEVLELLSNTIIDDSYGEYAEAAQHHKDAGIAKLNAAIAEREIFEKQRAELKVNQDALAAAQKEIDKKAEKAQKEIDEKAAELEKIRLANEVEAQRLKDETDKLVADEKQRKENLAQTELEEKQRKEKERLDAETKIERDAELYKRLPEDVKLRSYADALLALKEPAINDAELKGVLQKALLAVGHIAGDIYLETQGESDVSANT